MDTMAMDMVIWDTMDMGMVMDIMATIMAKGPLKLSLKQMLLPNQGMDTMDMDMDMDTMDMVMVMVMDMDIMLSMDTSMGRGLLMLSQAMDIMDTMDMDMDTMAMDTVMVTMDIMDNLQDFSLEWRTLICKHCRNCLPKE